MINFCENARRCFHAYLLTAAEIEAKKSPSRSVSVSRCTKPRSRNRTERNQDCKA